MNEVHSLNVNGTSCFWERNSLPLGKRTLLMGIVNLTPDSFSDGGKFTELSAAVEHIHQLEAEGADIIDIGGESSRPGAEPISIKEELKRVMPVIEKIKDKIKTPISIDTYKAEVAAEALAAGAQIVNDITALGNNDNMAEIVARYNAGIVLMHLRGTPKTMQTDTHYTNLIKEVSTFLKERATKAINAGIKKENIIIDPGLGFGKNVEQNLKLIKALPLFKQLGFPLLMGPSRKSFIGKILNLPVEQRLLGTAATVALCSWLGAEIIRIHDVKEMKEVCRIIEAINSVEIEEKVIRQFLGGESSFL